MRHVIDRVADCLDRGEQVPPDLAAELLIAMPADERAECIRIALAVAQEIECWEDHYRQVEEGA